MTSLLIRNQLLRNENIRLSTMLYLNIPNDQKINIARNGFYYDEQNEKFVCFQCNFSTGFYHRENLMKRHFMHYSRDFECHWLEGRVTNIRPSRKSIIKGVPDIFDYVYINRIVDEIDITSFDINDVPVMINDENSRNQIYLSYISEPIFIPMNGLSIEVFDSEKYYIALRSEQLRIATFRMKNYKFPLDRDNSNIVERLAKLGFFYTFSGCNIQCAFCHVVFGDFERIINSDIESVHNEIVKKYPFMVCTKTQNIPYMVVNIPRNMIEATPEYQERDSTVMCKCCFNADINIVYECGHITFCSNCAFACGCCIICSKPLIGGRRIYFT